MLRKTMRRQLFTGLIFLLCLFPLANSHAFETKGQECSKCHTLNKDQARDLLKSAISDVAVLDVQPSPVKGFWEVYLESRGKKGIVYIDFQKKHFLWGSLVSLGDMRNLTQERMIELNRVDVSQIPLHDALVMGDDKARIRVIVFTDPD